LRKLDIFIVQSPLELDSVDAREKESGGIGGVGLLLVMVGHGFGITISPYLCIRDLPNLLWSSNFTSRSCGHQLIVYLLKKCNMGTFFIKTKTIPSLSFHLI
jgi:hypothetical protein